MKKKMGAVGAGQFSLGTLVGGQPGTTISQNPGGGGEGGWGGSHTRTGPGRPPPRHSVYVSKKEENFFIPQPEESSAMEDLQHIHTLNRIQKV